MAIKRRVHKRGGDEQHMVVPEFSFATNVGGTLNTADIGDKLAQMIVDAWQNKNFTYTTGGTSVTKQLGKALTERDDKTGLPTRSAIDCATTYIQSTIGLNLSRAVVITEWEHDNDYILQSDDEIAFVLPDPSRVVSISAANVLQTAEFLMACTPNGI